METTYLKENPVSPRVYPKFQKKEKSHWVYVFTQTRIELKDHFLIEFTSLLKQG